MKKLIVIIAVSLLLAGMTISVYAQGEPILEGAPGSYDFGTDNPFAENKNAGVYATTNSGEGSLFDEPEWYKAFGFETDPRIDNPDWDFQEWKKSLNDDLGDGTIISEGGNSIGNNKNDFGLWIWAVGGIFLLGTAAILYTNRTRLIPALQTTNGNVVTENAPISTKQTIAAIKNSALTPSDDVFKSIMEKVNNEKNKQPKH